MTTEIGPARRSAPKERRGPGMILRALGLGARPRTQDERDDDTVTRVQRLSAFVEGRAVPDVWTKDLAPIFAEVFDQEVTSLIATANTLVSPSASRPDATVIACMASRLAMLEQLYRKIDAQGELAPGVTERLAKRHMEQQTA